MRGFLAVLLLVVLSEASYSSDYPISSCQYNLFGNNARYSLLHNLSCGGSLGISFVRNATNNTVECYGNQISSNTHSLLFGNNTYNNTLLNCTLQGNVLSLHGAQNNLISTNGTYSLNFTDNSSNIALGSLFHLLLYSTDHNQSVAEFIEIMPNQLFRQAPYHLNVMGLTMQMVVAEARQLNFRLPRFGVYPQATSNGSTYFKIEYRQVSRNGSIVFDPYYYYTPYEQYDQIHWLIFNSTHNSLLAPVYLAPHTDLIQPANKPVYWNYTLIFHNYTKRSKLWLLNSFQGDPMASTVATFYNLSNGSLSYNPSINSLGLHEFIALLDTPYGHENSTTSTYSVGVSFCMDDTSRIDQPGYYPLVYNSLHELNVFWLTSQTCMIGVDVNSDNVIIDCRGANVFSSVVNFNIFGSKNVTIENCKLHGNGVNTQYSLLYIYNTSFNATRGSDYAVNATGSGPNSIVYLINNTFTGFATPVQNASAKVFYLTSQNYKPPSVKYIQPNQMYDASIGVDRSSAIFSLALASMLVLLCVYIAYSVLLVLFKR